MSTRSFIAKQIGADTYRTIYCHSDGYLTYNGALLLDRYNSEDMVDKLLALGDISYLGLELEPDPSKPHSYNFDERQAGVTLAYGRDRGEKNIDARNMSLKKLDDPYNWTEYVYIYSKEGVWKYFEAGHSGEGLRDVKDDLNAEYARYGIKRPEGYYGFLSEGIVEEMKEQAQGEYEELGGEERPLSLEVR